MKKNYTLSLLVVCAFSVSSAFAQNRTAYIKHTVVTDYTQSNPIQMEGVIDTLTNHWDAIGPIPVDTPTIYSSASGFMAGQNNYGDVAKAQKFDSNFGVTQGGTIKSVLFWFGAKMVGAGTAMFTPTIWSDNSGAPGSVLGTGTAFSITSIDTTLAGFKIIGTSAGVEGGYNVSATFSTPVNIPANKIFWAGMSFTYANGDSAGLVSSRDYKPGDGIGVTGNFPQANTHTFEQQTGGWSTFNDGTTTAGNTWASDIALAIYPVVDLGLGVNELNASLAWVQNAPNPAVSSTTINYELKENTDVTLSVYNITGEQIFSTSPGMQFKGEHSIKLDVSSMSAGMYFYTVTTKSGNLFNTLSVIK